MMIGLIHPPFGMLLFVTKALTGIPIGEMMMASIMVLVTKSVNSHNDLFFSGREAPQDEAR